MNVAETIRSMGRLLACATKGENTYEIPAEACSAQPDGRTFSGTINLATAQITLACTEEPMFSLNVELEKCKFWEAATECGKVATAEDFAEWRKRKHESATFQLCNSIKGHGGGKLEQVALPPKKRRGSERT
tara:strand:+ start:560 stop:955 length:396 start_codon:yes stop_codon:yes gene_type:complete